ncbi:MAG: response regulator [Anaeromyxobacteraceae bacterium]
MELTERAGGGRAKVLVVDDEAIVRRTIERALSAQCDVSAAADGRGALALVRTGARFDAILCDLMMPEMNGAEVHAALLREAPDQARRFAILTGGAFSPRAEALLEACACPVVEKPFSRAALLACVSALQAG